LFSSSGLATSLDDAEAPPSVDSRLSVIRLDRQEHGTEILEVKWTGELPQSVNVWVDADADGKYSDADWALVDGWLTESTQKVKVALPVWGGRCAWPRIRVEVCGEFAEIGVGEQTSTAVSCAWSALGTGLQPDTYENVEALVMYDDGSGAALYAGGAFWGAPANHLAKWDGSSWSEVGGGTDDHVFALAVYDDGSGAALYAGGNFTMVGEVSATSIAKWDGSDWSALGNGVSGVVRALTVYDDGSGAALYVGGYFSTAGEVSASRIAKWNGVSWSEVGGGISGFPGWPYGVATLAVHDDGSGAALYAAGFFSTAGGISASSIARWDGSNWSNVGDGLNAAPNEVRALSVYNDGSGTKLYAGGGFTTDFGAPVDFLAKWDGSTWTGVGGGTNNPVFALAAYNDGSGAALYAGGNFTMAGGVPASRIAKWNGISWSALDSGVDDACKALEVYAGGTVEILYVGGRFATAGGIQSSGVARWSCHSPIFVDGFESGNTTAWSNTVP
jgi:hypothetical protein